MAGRRDVRRVISAGVSGGRVVGAGWARDPIVVLLTITNGVRFQGFSEDSSDHPW